MNLTEDPIPKLIRQIAIPASVGFFFNTMYNIVDTWFAGRVSTEAQAALSVSFPVFFIIIAVGSGLGQGGTALISNALGEKNHDKAQHYALQSVTFGILLGLILTVAGLMSAPWMFRQLGASESYLETSLLYMNAILLGTVLFLTASILNAGLNAQGDTKTFRNLLILGFVLNCILDPWFMYGGLGLPAMGIRGIALATVLIQVVECVLLVAVLLRTNLWKDFHPRRLVPKLSTFREIAVQGFPASLNMMTVAIGIFVITWFAGRFDMEAVAAYGVATRIEQILLLPTIGLNIAMLSLTGQNNGARHFDRIREALNTSMKYGIIMCLVGGVLLYFLGGLGMRFFSPDETVVRIGYDYLKVASITLCAYVILFQTVYMLQGLKRPMYAIWIGLYRQIVAPVLVFHVLAFTLGWGLMGIWWGVFFVTWSAAIFTCLYGRRVLRRVEKGK